MGLKHRLLTWGQWWSVFFVRFYLLRFSLSNVNVIPEILYLSPSSPQRSILFHPNRTLDQIYTIQWRLSCLVTQQDFISSGELQLLCCCCAVKQEMCVSALRLSDAFPLLSHTWAQFPVRLRALHRVKSSRTQDETLFPLTLSLPFSLFFFFTLFLTWPWPAAENNTHCTPIQGCVWEAFYKCVSVDCHCVLWMKVLCGMLLCCFRALNLWGPLKATRMFVMWIW